jgi:hypothetical protein
VLIYEHVDYTNGNSKDYTTAFNFAVDCAARKVQKNQVGLKLNETHQLLSCADDMNLLGDNRTEPKNSVAIVLTGRTSIPRNIIS